MKYTTGDRVRITKHPMAGYVGRTATVDASQYLGDRTEFVGAVAAAVSAPAVADRIATAVVEAQRGRDGSR